MCDTFWKLTPDSEDQTAVIAIAAVSTVMFNEQFKTQKRNKIKNMGNIVASWVKWIWSLHLVTSKYDNGMTWRLKKLSSNDRREHFRNVSLNAKR